MPPIEVHLTPSSRAQAAFWDSTARHRAFVGGVGSGKTLAGAVALLQESLANPRTTALVVAPTYKILRDAAQKTFLDLFAPLIASHNQSRNETTLVNRALILWRSADAPDALRGVNAGHAWLDEGAYCDDTTWPILIGRLRAGSGRAWITTTPKGKGWLFDLLGHGHAHFHFARTDDNQALPAAYVQDLRRQYSDKWAAQELDGEFVDWSGGIFKREWIRAIAPHALPRDLRWVRAWDTATSAKTTADETAGVKAALDRAGNLYLAAPIAGRWEGPEALEVIVQTALTDTRAVPVGVEAVAAQIHAFQHLQRDPRLAAHRLLPLSRTTDKVSAALPWCARASGGRLYLVEGFDWSGWVEQWVAFPSAKHDDRVDAVSHAVLLAADDPTAWAAALRS